MSCITKTREEWQPQRERLDNVLRQTAERILEKTDGEDKEVTVRAGKLLAQANIKRNTFYDRNMPSKLDLIDGINYVYKEGLIDIQARTYLENREDTEVPEEYREDE